MIKKKFLYLLLFVIFSFIFSQVRFIRNTLVLNNFETYNGRNKFYIWIGEGDCSQKENMPPMFVMKKSSILKNINMINAPDGIHIYGDNVKLNNIRNLNVCEDAISTKRYVTNIQINNSLFISCQDKAIQLNYGDDFYIKNNVFLFCKQPIRIPKQTRNIKMDNNFYHGVSDKYYLRSK